MTACLLCFSKQSRLARRTGGVPAGGAFAGAGTSRPQTVAGSVRTPSWVRGSVGPWVLGSGGGVCARAGTAAATIATKVRRAGSRIKGRTVPPSGGQVTSLLDFRRRRPQHGRTQGPTDPGTQGPRDLSQRSAVGQHAGGPVGEA